MYRGFVTFGVTGMLIASGIGGNLGGAIGALVGWTVAATFGLVGG